VKVGQDILKVWPEITLIHHNQPERVTDFHSHPDEHQIFLVLQGQCRLELPSLETLYASAGRMLYVPPGAEHAFRSYQNDMESGERIIANIKTSAWSGAGGIELPAYAAAGISLVLELFFFLLLHSDHLSAQPFVQTLVTVLCESHRLSGGALKDSSYGQGGLSVFRSKGIEIVASKATAQAMPGVHAYKKYFFVNIAKMFTEENFPKLVLPDVTFEDSLTLSLSNDVSVKLKEFHKAGVSSNQTVAWIPKAQTVLVGDLIHNGAHAWLEGGIGDGKAKPQIESWINLLEQIKSEYPVQASVASGRGKIGTLAAGVEGQIQYLRKADEIVSSYVEKLGARESELTNEKSAGHFKALTEEFEKAFPDRTLSYLITYGVYGLAQSKIQP
jgi:mannose-6-phosphate isomerase-like protein (cupin superfamily)/glyoxylase-like metal-dependent hydrolase (beta-lactamase superfamily II)